MKNALMYLLCVAIGCALGLGIGRFAFGQGPVTPGQAQDGTDVAIADETDQASDADEDWPIDGFIETDDGQPICMTSADDSTADPWTVTYEDARGQDRITATVGRWADGYFVAGNAHGRARVLSRPEHVIVDGKSYHYVSSKYVSRLSDADSVLAYARQNDGIGFQATYKDGWAVVHYEPDQQ